MRSSLLVLVAIAGCGEPGTPGTVRARISSDLANVLHESKNAAGASTDLPGSALLGFATMAGAATAMTSFDPDATIRWLDDKLFTDQNYLGDGIYRVPPELACTTDSIVDPTCVARLAKAELRIRTEADGDGLHFWMQLDADHDEPIELVLRHDELSVTANLDDAGHAMLALAEAFGEQAPNAALAGQITADVKILGYAHAVVSVSFDRPLAIALADQGAPLDGPTATRITSAAATVASVELDGNAPRLVAHLGLGETTAHLPGTADYRDLDLAGATADAVFDGVTLALTNLSLGTHTTTVARNGVQAIAIDLNPGDGRALSATITTDTAGVETATVTPRLDLHIATDHAALGDTAPMYDVTRLQLDGSVRGDRVSNQLAVLAGSLVMTTSPAQYGFAATAGQCVTQTSVTDAMTFASYTQFAVGACH